MAPDDAPLVLNVNDSPAARYLVSRLLRSIECEVIEAETGRQALDLAFGQKRPDLVILDIRLPDIDGFEVCRRIKQNPETASCPVLQTSATFVTGEGKARGLDSGADAYLTQPFEPVEFVAMVRSLLRLRRTEQQARERADALVFADKRKDEFLAMLAHELRNPLSTILVATNLLDRAASMGAVPKLSQTIARQARHLGRLVDDLLDVSRITRDKIHLNKVPLDLRESVSVVLDEERPGIERRRQKLAVRLPDRPVFVHADATRVAQIVANFVSNATKYSDGGGEIQASLELLPGGVARFRIDDSGIGIARENLDSVWDLFFQVDASLARSRSGLGIGLTMVRRLVEMHGGVVGASSEGVGRGSSFWFDLPTVDTPSEVPAKPAVHADVSGQTGRVLVIDDNVDSCELYCVAFRHAGYEADAVHDGAEGVERALSARFDVAVVDIGLPLVDGYEVARTLRRELGDRCPFLVALTGYGRPEDRALAIEAGFDAHRVKPTDTEDLLRLFETARRGHKATPTMDLTQSGP